MKNQTILHSFQSVLPKFNFPQDKIVEWTLKAHLKALSLSETTGDSEGQMLKLKRFTLSKNDIKQRYFEYGDLSEDWDDHEIYQLKSDFPQGVSMEVRGRYFSKKINRVMEELYHHETPQHLIHVTCTGYASPSAPQIFFSQKPKAPTITHAYHMGCYASLPSIRMGDALALARNETVDILHTELCSLHLNPSLHTPEQMVVQSLFADGHIKYSVGTEAKEGLKLISIHEELIPNSVDDMTWTPGQFGMLMTLSRSVPVKIKDGLTSFLENLCEKAEVKVSDVLENALFAIHPGGPKIIDAVKKKLNLKEEQIQFSQQVLLERGNMSSATLPHVWDEILKSKPENGKRVISFAFGPGLTIFGSIFEVKRE